ncbi:MAG TPA: type II toxin-antitoxin system prevent-host-death family antitoxin [Candidatus Deferrimicrobiaceae bacterium]|nr:type II toxin-antitoxin system prevent-host-death family antitoxin [Candidatus Deferrimicrobiaceae bacterium]
MKKMSVREARQALSRLEQVLEEEGEVTITRRGRAVARVVSVEGKRAIPSHKALRASMPRLRRGSGRLVREDRDAR